jgi:hypothetical protein
MFAVTQGNPMSQIERKLTDTISFILDYVPRLKFLKHDVSETGSDSVFS